MWVNWTNGLQSIWAFSLNGLPLWAKLITWKGPWSDKFWKIKIKIKIKRFGGLYLKKKGHIFSCVLKIVFNFQKHFGTIVKTKKKFKIFFKILK